MAKADRAVARQRERDRRQVRQHYVHWGVKTLVSLLAAVILGALWLAWLYLTQ
jgi:hypothetical protein